MRIIATIAFPPDARGLRLARLELKAVIHRDLRLTRTSG